MPGGADYGGRSGVPAPPGALGAGAGAAGGEGDACSAPPPQGVDMHLKYLYFTFIPLSLV